MRKKIFITSLLSLIIICNILLLDFIFGTDFPSSIQMKGDATMKSLKETYLLLYQICHLNLRQWDVDQNNSANDDNYQQPL